MIATGDSSGRSRWTRLIRASIGVYVVGVVVVLTPIERSIAEILDGSPSAAPTSLAPAPTVIEGQPVAPVDGTPVPVLTQAQLERAEQLVRSNTTLAAALQGVNYTVSRSGPWTTIGGDSPATLIGAALVLRLDRGVPLSRAQLPAAHYDLSETRSPPYQEVVNTVTAAEVTELEVQVDLERDRLVHVEPHPLSSVGVTIEPPEGFVREVPRPTEGE